MSIFVSLGLIILSAFVHATLQLGTGSLVLLLTSVIGKNYPARAKSLARSFISGFGLFIFLALTFASFTVSYLGSFTFPPIFLAILTGLLFADALIMWFFYYRPGKSTALWLPRSTAHFFTSRLAQIKTTTDAFSLGVFVCLAELPLSLALFFTATLGITALPETYRGFALVFYIIIATLPLFITNFIAFHGRTVVEIQRWRVKNKTFFKILSGVLFLILAVFIFAFKLLGVTL